MILMNDFKAEPQKLREAMLSATERVIDSGWYVLGREVEAFEQRWAQTCRIDCAVGMGNGMDAIEIALRALDIGPGDEVITTSMTAFASVLAIMRSGATPVLADIDQHTGLLSMNSVQRCISDKTKAVLLVHLYGQVREVQQWQNFCCASDIYLIEDCAQAHLAESEGSVAGSFGVAGAYSFYPTKNLGALGDGGALVTNDCVIADRAKTLRNYGQSERYHHPELGLNSRLDEIHAAILLERLTYLEQFTSRRREIAKFYTSQISNDWVTNLEAPLEESAHSYHLYVILSDKRDRLTSHLQDRGVQTHIHYPIPINHQKACLNILRDSAGLEGAEHHAARCLSLPCHPGMTNNDVDIVVAAINSFRG